MSEKNENRIALITGASRGIGRAVALELAKQGHDIIAVARTHSQGALEELDDEIRSLGQNCTLVPFDLRDGDSIDRLGAAIYERWGKLDVLVANAGILGPLTPLSHMTLKDWNEILEINLTANWRLIRTTDPLLRQSDAGRVIVVSSAASGKAKAYWGGYAITKAAVQEMALTYANECLQTPMKVNVISTGPIHTHMRTKAMPGEDPSTLPTPADIAPLFAELASPAYETTGGIVNFYDWAGIKRPTP